MLSQNRQSTSLWTREPATSFRFCGFTLVVHAGCTERFSLRGLLDHTVVIAPTLEDKRKFASLVALSVSNALSCVSSTAKNLRKVAELPVRVVDLALPAAGLPVHREEALAVLAADAVTPLVGDHEAPAGVVVGEAVRQPVQRPRVFGECQSLVIVPAVQRPRDVLGPRTLR